MAQIQKRTTSEGTVRWTMRVFVGRDPNTGKRKFVTETFEREKDAKVQARKLEGCEDDLAWCSIGSLPGILADIEETGLLKGPFAQYVKSAKWTPATSFGPSLLLFYAEPLVEEQDEEDLLFAAAEEPL